MKRICENPKCNKSLDGHPSKKYCNRSCQNEAFREKHKKRFEFACQACGRKFFKWRKTNKLGQGHPYCSRRCANLTNAKNIRQERLFHTGGYVAVYSPDHPRAYGGRVKEHTLVVEKALGRFLRSGEEVHHINGIRDDNREENLVVCERPQEHRFIERMTNHLFREFIRTKGLGEELTAFLESRFFSKYSPGDWEQLRDRRPSELREYFGLDRPIC